MKQIDNRQKQHILGRVESKLSLARKKPSPAKKAVLRLAKITRSPSETVSEETKEMPPTTEASPVSDSPTPYVRQEAKVGRNDPCPCGSGKKYKKCCLAEKSKGLGWAGTPV